MASRADTKALGLHGLFIEAQRRDDLASARAYAEEAARTAPVARLGRPGGAGIPLRQPAIGPARLRSSNAPRARSTRRSIAASAR